MKMVWQILARELGPGFITQYGDTEGEDFLYWENDLKELSSSDFERGLIKFKSKSGTFISLKLFRELCIASNDDLGLPSMQDSYLSLVLGEWHKMPEAFRVLFVQHRYQLRNMTDTAGRAFFKPIYEDAIKRIAAGEQIKIQKREMLDNPSGLTKSKKVDGPTGKEAMKILLKTMGKKL